MEIEIGWQKLRKAFFKIESNSTQYQLQLNDLLRQMRDKRIEMNNAQSNISREDKRRALFKINDVYKIVASRNPGRTLIIASRYRIPWF